MTDPFDWNWNESDTGWAGAPKLRAPKPEPVRRTPAGKVIGPPKDALGKLYLSLEDCNHLMMVLTTHIHEGGIVEDINRTKSIVASLEQIRTKKLGDDGEDW